MKETLYLLALFRLVFSRFFDIRGNLGNVKEKPDRTKQTDSETENVCLVSQEVSLAKYIQYKNIQMEWGEPFYKKVACLHVIFISQHFDWVLCIISECDWMNYF